MLTSSPQESWQEALRSLRWGRLAEPQADMYDARAVLSIVAATTTTERPRPYVRTTPIGRVEIAQLYGPNERPSQDRRQFYDADPDHPCITEALALFQRWPLGRDHVHWLLEAVHPALDRDFPAVLPRHRIVSASHSVEARFGTLWSTVNSAIGLAQSIVHELSHHKLRALGISTECADTVVANDCDQLYPSPLVAFRRPMPAVLHAHYALLHMAALDSALLMTARSQLERVALSRSFVQHMSRLRVSAWVIRRHLVVDAFGVSFMGAMWDWMGRVMERTKLHVV